MIFTRAFKKSDYTAFDTIEAIASPVDLEFAQAIEDSSLAVTGVRNGEPVICGGVHPVDDFHGEMWLRLSKKCKGFPIETIRLLDDAFEIIEKNYPFKQLNATIKCGFKSSVKLIKHLGFTLTECKENDGQQWEIYSKRVQE